MSQLKGITEFHCAICKDTVRFDPTDEGTYESKSSEEDFFGMRLTTYRVSHMVGNEKHVNTVIVDRSGLYRGHKDVFSLNVGQQVEPASRAWWLLKRGPKALTQHSHLEASLLMDLDECWVMEMVNTTAVRSVEMARLVMERIEEAHRIYETVPTTLTVSVAGQDVHVWRSDHRIVCMKLKTPTAYATLDWLARRMIALDDNGPYPDKRLLLLAMRAIGSNPRLDTALLTRLLEDNLFFATVNFPYVSRIPSIVRRLQSRFPDAEGFLTPLLRGSATVIDLLEQGYIEKLPAIVEMIDYVNRRGLIGQEE
ncbi:MAG: hypothetical protein QXS20_10680 [Candidatus Thorarchaeota archaeon]